MDWKNLDDLIPKNFKMVLNIKELVKLVFLLDL